MNYKSLSELLEEERALCAGLQTRANILDAMCEVDLEDPERAEKHRQFFCVDGSSIRREPNLHTENNIPALRIKAARCALKNLLISPAHRDQPTLPRSLCLKSKLIRLSTELSRQFILKSNTLMMTLI